MTKLRRAVPPTTKRHWRLPVLLIAGAMCVATAVTVQAQFGRRAFSRAAVATPADFDGRFHYCRVVYRSDFGGRGGSWRTDYPMADINLSIRLSELTRTDVSTNASGAPNNLLVRLGGEEIFQCPLTILSAPGSALIDTPEAELLREYLLKGGMLWVDDFWGTYQWEHWVGQFRKVLSPAEYPIFEVPLDHPMFRTQFVVSEVPQIPNIGFFLRSGGGTSEQGADSAIPHAWGVADSSGRLMVLMTHNTDIADSWEREGEDPNYFYTFSPRGYAFAVNVVLYALTH